MKNIAQAIVKAQQAFAPALKTNANPFFKSKYADLSVCIEAVIDALHSNGVALIQRNHDCENGVKVETIFLHESGEEYSGGILHVPALKNDPQAYGSALTYARRYSLMATCGIAPEDDDGNAASKNVATPKESAKSIAKSEWDVLSIDEQNFLTEIAINVVDAISKNDLVEANRLLNENNLDATEKVALWSRFDSKQRSTIKSYNESLKKGA